MILLSDYSLMNYDLAKKTKKLETKELEKYNPIEISILYYQIPLFDKDYLLVLGENSILLLNITTFIIEYNITLKEKPISMELFVLNNTYFISIMFKFKIFIYTIVRNNNKNLKNVLNFLVFREIQSNEGDKIISERLFLYKNLYAYHTSTKIIFSTFKTPKNLKEQIIVFDKKQNFQRKIPNSDELNTLRKKLDSLSKKYNVDKFKDLDIYKNTLIEYTPMNNYFIFATFNRLFIIKCFYDSGKECLEESEINNTKGQYKFKILDKITKPNVILLLKIIMIFF